MKNKPAPSNIANPEEVDGKKWWYCPVHGWCLHPFDEQEDILGCFYNRNNTKQRPRRRRVSNDSSNSNDNPHFDLSRTRHNSSPVATNYAAFVDNNSGTMPSYRPVRSDDGHDEEEDDHGAPLLIDSHGREVADPVWTLLDYTLERAGAKPILIEWDANIPDWPTLAEEARRAARALEKVPA